MIGIPKTKQDSTVECQVPITISIGYGWSEHNPEDEAKYKNQNGLNEQWNFLRNEAEKAVAEFSKRAAKRERSKCPLKISIHRLRSRHGATLFAGILKKIDRSDILFFDITGRNPNVHFELGYAIAKKGANSGRVFIFHKKDKEADNKNQKTEPCSDIAGYMLTFYNSSNKGEKSMGFKKDQYKFKLKDQRGFRAALISSLTDVARVREMWGVATTTFETESDAES